MDPMSVAEFDTSNMTKYPMILIISKDSVNRVKLINHILELYNMQTKNGLILDSIDKIWDHYSTAFPDANVVHEYDKKLLEKYTYNHDNYIVFDTLKDVHALSYNTFLRLHLSSNLVVVCTPHPLLIPRNQRHIFSYVIISQSQYNYIYPTIYDWYKKIFPEHAEQFLKFITIDYNKDYFVIDNSNYDVPYTKKLYWYDIKKINKTQPYPTDEEIYSGKYVMCLTI